MKKDTLNCGHSNLFLHSLTSKALRKGYQGFSTCYQCTNSFCWILLPHWSKSLLPTFGVPTLGLRCSSKFGQTGQHNSATDKRFLPFLTFNSRVLLESSLTTWTEHPVDEMEIRKVKLNTCVLTHKFDHQKQHNTVQPKTYINIILITDIFMHLRTYTVDTVYIHRIANLEDFDPQLLFQRLRF